MRRLILSAAIVAALASCGSTIGTERAERPAPLKLAVRMAKVHAVPTREEAQAGTIMPKRVMQLSTLFEVGDVVEVKGKHFQIDSIAK